MKECIIMILLIPVGALAIAIATLRFGKKGKEMITESIDVQHEG